MEEVIINQQSSVDVSGNHFLNQIRSIIFAVSIIL
jgi:hypothetical protein